MRLPRLFQRRPRPVDRYVFADVPVADPNGVQSYVDKGYHIYSIGDGRVYLKKAVS
jgi:hypothetical protein